jgi:hypothetical protein
MWTIEFRNTESEMWQALSGRFKHIDYACQHARLVFKEEYIAAVEGGPVLVRIDGPHYGSKTCKGTHRTYGMARSTLLSSAP